MLVPLDLDIPIGHEFINQVRIRYRQRAGGAVRQACPYPCRWIAPVVREVPAEECHTFHDPKMTVKLQYERVVTPRQAHKLNMRSKFQ